MPCSSPKMFSDDDIIGDDFLEEETMLEIESIRGRLKENLPLYMVPSTFVRLKALPIRISGKLDRGRITDLIESLPDYESLTKSEKIQNRPNIGDAERTMETVLLELFPASPDSLDLDLNFKQLGGDSILAMAAAMRLKSYGLMIKYSDLIGDKSLSWIANGCAKQGKENKSPSSTFLKHETQKATARATEVPNSNRASETGGNISTAALTPIQHIYFETLQWPRRFHSSQSLRVKSLANKDVLHSISRLVERHDMLRARFDRYDGTWQQRIEPISDRAYALSTHRDVPASGMTHIIAGAHESIDIVNGPVFAAVIFTDARDDVEYIHLIAHHLVVDMVSWHIVMRELDASLCGHRLANGESTTYLAWQQRQAEYGKALRPEGLLPAVILPAPVAYWGGTYTSESLLGASSDRNSLKDITSEIFELSPDTTDLLWKRCAESLSLQVVDVLLACFLSSFLNAFPDRRDVCVWNQVHGRDGVWDDDIDIEGTVGWFNIFVPIRIDDTFVGRMNEIDALVEFVNGYRASIPAHGLPYFTSRTFNTQAREEARSHMPMEVVFNYVGRSVASGNAYQAFTPVSLDLPGKGVHEIDPEFKLTHVLDIMVEVGVKGELRCRLGFDRLIAHQNELKNCWQGFEAALITWAEGAF